ncbi:Protein of unknown function (DUF1638) [Mariprofundus ferrinatatus]|uniref:histidine kinase n=1 Tax=Mariprofundus ferrinatatus TaxID=1921087 RepID=A0A2K8L4A6_9PROT|nr:ATP-binding protein [Mariprofundus ferrinatatus]ATX82117.1 Protein of unknown function (DUF1638) [Mariprofundus ferrinatatus]
MNFPTSCGHPPTDWQKVIEADEEGDDAVLVLGGCCTSNLDPAQWPDRRIKVHHVEQCFHLFMQPQLVNHYMAKGYYLITPGWLSGWKNQIERVMGFDQNNARAFFQETAKLLLLVDTGTDAESVQRLAGLANYLDIPSDRMEVGLGYYSQLLKCLYHEMSSGEIQERLDEALRQQAEYAMVADLLGRLTDQKSEFDIIHTLIDTFQMLLAPKQCSYTPWEEGDFGQPLCSEPDHATAARASIDPAGGDYGWIDDTGFWVRISSSDETFGFIAVEKIAFPQYRSRYLNMALLIRNVASLAISHARDFQMIADLSHDSGKGEVAREVIHNAGNTLNSINISVQQLQSLLERSSIRSLPAIVALMHEQGDRLGEFIASDPKGQKIPAYFDQLASALDTEQMQWRDELGWLAEYVEHVRAIVQSQSGALANDEPLEPVSPAKLLKIVLNQNAQRIHELDIELDQEIGPVPTCALQKHKVLQVLGNLLMNATEALSQVDGRKRLLKLSVQMAGYDHFYFEVADNGPGISDELREKAFLHGFTTKVGHSGFGLHNAANLAFEMGGRLSLAHGDTDMGACFRLELPLTVKHG